MKKKRWAIGGACIVLLICAAVLFMVGKNSVIYGLSAGTYSSEFDSSQITFDFAQDSISFVYKVHGEITMQGSANIENGMVVCTSDNAEEMYRFKIIDNDYIGLVTKHSNVLYMDDGITPFENGATFKFSDER